MKVNREKLKEALTIVKPGLASKEVLEQTTSFAFLGGRVVTYDDEISISHPVEGIDFEGAIKAEELYGLLSKLKNEEVDMEVEGDELRINCGRVKAGLRLEEEINLPLQEVPDEWKKIKNPTQFQEYINLAAQTASNDMSDPKLTCVCVRDGLVIGSDGQRLIQCQLTDKFPTKAFLIPATNVIKLIKINPTHIQLEKDWIHFKNSEDSMFSCRRVKETYVDQDSIDDILNIDKKATIKFPSKILDTLLRVMTFSKRDFALEESVEVIIKDGKATLKAERDETKSWIKEKMTIKCKENLTFKITPSLFIDILQKTSILRVDKSLRRGKFTLKNEWDYLIMFRK